MCDVVQNSYIVIRNTVLIWDMAALFFQDGVHMHISEQWRNHEVMQTRIGTPRLCRPWRKELRIKNQGEMVIPLPLTLFVAQPWKPLKFHRRANLLPSASLLLCIHRNIRFSNFWSFCCSCIVIIIIIIGTATVQMKNGSCFPLNKIL